MYSLFKGGKNVIFSSENSSCLFYSVILRFQCLPHTLRPSDRPQPWSVRPQSVRRSEHGWWALDRGGQRNRGILKENK